jgi:hypothetical protein
MVIKRIKSPNRNIHSHRENETAPRNKAITIISERWALVLTHYSGLLAGIHGLIAAVENVEKNTESGASWHVLIIKFR